MKEDLADCDSYGPDMECREADKLSAADMW